MAAMNMLNCMGKNMRGLNPTKRTTDTQIKLETEYLVFLPIGKHQLFVQGGKALKTYI